MHSKFSLLYFHFPFCETRCHYCDFYALAEHRVSELEKNGFYQSLQLEIDKAIEDDLVEPIEAIFMGGGTPSLTPPKVMTNLMTSLLGKVSFVENYEWTMEANPSSIRETHLTAYQDLGVNRLSVGIQSLNENHLKKLGRAHTPLEAREALDSVFRSGFKNVSVDLMCGLPGQTLSQLENDIECLTEYPIIHLSCYLLTLPPHHPLYSELPSEEAQVDHLLLIDQKLKSLGFEHYEISNFCKAGKRASHNLAVWNGSSYLGFGPSAHSFCRNQKKRWRNFPSLRKYQEALTQNQWPRFEEETLTQSQLELEKWMLKLRLSDGVPLTWIQSQKQLEKMNAFRKEKLIEDHPEKPQRFRLTSLGYTMSDQIILEIADF